MSTPICPGCGKGFRKATSALSRFDNKTPICAVCGHVEGITQFIAANAGLDPRSVLRSPGRLTPTGSRLFNKHGKRSA